MKGIVLSKQRKILNYGGGIKVVVFILIFKYYNNINIIKMLSTKSLISSINDVPEVWIFEHYGQLAEKLIGQDVKMLSLFNPKDKVPSLCIYYKDGKYKFKDFSTGHGGNTVEFVKMIYGLEYAPAVNKIVEDYNEFVVSNGDYSLGKFKKHSKYKITEFCKRAWNIQDRDYWLQYGIGSVQLEKYWVYPLDFYKMEKEGETEKKELHISGPYVYGYFKSNGDLYKVYQPKIRDKKFLNVKDYIQGVDQLKYDKPNLLIGSSMKDILAFNQFEWPFEVVAPGSENTMVKKEVIETWRHKYKLIVVLFDNDDPGIKAAAKYLKQYNTPSLELKLSKDLSDSVRDHGTVSVMKELHPQLKKLIKNE